MELEKLLIAAEIPAARIFTMADIFNDEQYRARKMLDKVPDADLGTVTLTGVVPKLSETPGSLRCTGGCVGRDTREVLSTLAGLSDRQLDDLEAEGVIRTATVTDRNGGA
jgi:crotonobetainyl-CoA:carnitine CoA-transferase CaiB-like acyl-CoA transferase